MTMWSAVIVFFLSKTEKVMDLFNESDEKTRLVSYYAPDWLAEHEKRAWVWNSFPVRYWHQRGIFHPDELATKARVK